MKNFAVIGVAGFVAPRHLNAIRDTGNRLLAALDPNDSVGLLDRYSLDVHYFREIERFDRFLEKLRHGSEEHRVHYVSICSPSHLHDAHARLALRVGATAICEKPLVINPWNLDALQELEHETGGSVYTVLQLRAHPALLALRKEIEASASDRKADVTLTYVTARGGWYDVSWKGSEERSGGVAMNIGIHFFDMLLWLFGKVQRSEVHVREDRRMAGFLELERATVRWFLSIRNDDLPFETTPGVPTTYRHIDIDGRTLEFTEGFADLHTRVYEQTLDGRGYGTEEARAGIELVHQIRTAPVTQHETALHPYLLQKPRRLAESG